MAKLATQNIVIQISKAVSDSADEEIDVLTIETIEQLIAVVTELVGDDGAVVEVVL